MNNNSRLSFQRVAVLLAAYNGIKWIEEQVQTILQQKNVSVDLFISVDTSVDGTYEWCKRLENSSHNVTVLEYGKCFGGAARNFFQLIKDVDFSLFDYIAFADQDDVWFLDKVSHGIKEMRINNAEAYSANVIAFWSDGRERLINKSQPQRKLDYLFEAAGPGCTYIFTKKSAILIKKTLNKFPQLNDFTLHDWLSYAVLRHNGFKWFIDPIPKMRYRQHSANQIGANVSFKGVVYRLGEILSGRVFDSIKLLVNVFGLSSIQLSSRKGILKLALNTRELRRRRVDQIIAFFLLCLYAIKGPKK